jgi:cytochrome b6-f complex iron-sulfur subunit
MAKRPSIQEILEAARRGGAGKAGAAEAPAAETASEPEAAAPASAAPAKAKAAVPAATPQTLGRPLTLQEKLAAARGGGAAPTAAAAGATPEAAAPKVEKTPAPTAASLGRPLTMAEKLAAARGGAAPAAPAGGAGAPATPKAAAAKPAAVAKRELPPLDKISDPKDLAEAARRAGAIQDKTHAPNPAAVAAKPAKEKETRPQSVLPRPSRAAAIGSAFSATRRAFTSLTALLVLAWVAFSLGILEFTLMTVRFMFPNVLAEPPSTIKIGLPTDYDAEAVNERFKADWGFWVVRSTRFNGNDILYALKSTCTHLGCPPNWLGGEQKFKCPCHGSGFYISGVNFEGPAPRPLERFKLSTGDDGQLVVDKSQIFQEELGQWADPDSYVSA